MIFGAGEFGERLVKLSEAKQCGKHQLWPSGTVQGTGAVKWEVGWVMGRPRSGSGPYKQTQNSRYVACCSGQSSRLRIGVGPGP